MEDLQVYMRCPLEVKPLTTKPLTPLKPLFPQCPPDTCLACEQIRKYNAAIENYKPEDAIIAEAIATNTSVICVDGVWYEILLPTPACSKVWDKPYRGDPLPSPLLSKEQ